MVAESARLEFRHLITHGTYTSTQISTLQERATKAVPSENLEELLALTNFLMLTETTVDAHNSLWMPDDSLLLSCLRNSSEVSELFSAIVDRNSHPLSMRIGYKYSPLGTDAPLKLGDNFPLGSDSNYLDVGSGFGVQGICVAETFGCPVTLVDPNAYNIRMTYHYLDMHGLLGDSRVQVKLSTIQETDLPLQSFDRAYLGCTPAAGDTELERVVLSRTLALLRPSGIIALHTYLAERVTTFEVPVEDHTIIGPYERNRFIRVLP